MAYDFGTTNPDGSLTFSGPSGSLTTAPTPSANAFLETLQSRQQQSAPFAMGGGDGASASRPAPAPVMSDAAPDMTGGAAGSSGGGYSTKNQQMVVQGASTGEQAPIAQEVSYAARVASPITGPTGDVKPGEVMLNQNGGANARGPAVGPANGFDLSADLNARAAEWELKHPGGGASGPKPGTYQTGLKMGEAREGIDPARVAGMADATRTQGLAGMAADQANAAYEGEVAGKMQAYENAEREKTEGVQDYYATQLREMSDRREKMEREVAETKIDPQQFWTDKTTGDKIAYMLAAAATGFFNGRAGIQGNQVLNAVSKRIDENVNAQIRNLETKKGSVGELGRLYQQLREQGLDANAARAVTHQRAILEAQKMVRGQTSEARSEAARAGGERVAADLASKVEGIYFNAADKIKADSDKTFKVVSAGANGTGGARNPYAKAAEYANKSGDAQAGSQKLVAGPDKKGGPTQRYVVNGTTYEAPNSGTEEGGKVRTIFSQADMAEALVDRIEKRAKESVFEKSSHTASAAQKEDVGRLAEVESVMKGQGVVKEPDIARKMDALLSVRSGDDAFKSTRAFINETRVSALKQGGAAPVKK